MGGEDGGGLAAGLCHFGDAGATGGIEGRIGALEEFQAGLVNEVVGAGGGLPEEAVRAAPLADLVRSAASGNVGNVTGEGFVVGKVLSAEHGFDADLAAQCAVGEGAAEALFEGGGFCVFDAINDAAEALCGDFVGDIDHSASLSIEFVALGKDEFAVTSIFLIEGKNSVSCRAATGKRVEDYSIFWERWQPG